MEGKQLEIFGDVKEILKDPDFCPFINGEQDEECKKLWDSKRKRFKIDLDYFFLCMSIFGDHKSCKEYQRRIKGKEKEG